MRPRTASAVRLALSLLAGAIVAFGALTWWALESSGVAVVETRAPDGSVRSTHVWYAEPDAELWLEAGTPQNPWFQDVRENPVLTFNSEGRTGRYRAQVVPGQSGHERIRSLLREKYGLRDWWVGLLVDTSGSIAVRLEEAPEGRGGPPGGRPGLQDPASRRPR